VSSSCSPLSTECVENGDDGLEYEETDDGQEEYGEAGGEGEDQGENGRGSDKLEETEAAISGIAYGD